MKSPRSSHWTLPASLLTVAAICVAGCGDQVQPEMFEPNLVHAIKYQLRSNHPDGPIDRAAMEQASADSTWVVQTMFGTPDEPKLPEIVAKDPKLASLVSMDGLMRASGPEDAEGRGLFRKHCALCHGVTGNGRGRTAAEQVPYPRDYRKGVFKFKSTPRGAKPTRDDLTKVIRDGIAGTAMKRIPELDDKDVKALVDYVIYLSLRGEHERLLVDAGTVYEYKFFVDGERLIDSDLGRKLLADPSLQQTYESSADEEDKEQYEIYLEDWDYAESLAVDIAESWIEADSEVVEVPDPPEGFPLAESYADVVAFRGSEKATQFDASVERGAKLFTGEVAACSKCHGKTGLGDGQTTDYDDWTKDWTLTVGLKPDDRDALIPLLARGALAPRNAIPRNFAEGIFRGGSSSKDLYLRITQGIAGSPMPAVTFVEGKFEPEDVWHIINFIRSLQTAEIEPGAEPAAPPMAQT